MTNRHIYDSEPGSGIAIRIAQVCTFLVFAFAVRAYAQHESESPTRPRTKIAAGTRTVTGTQTGTEARIRIGPNAQVGLGTSNSTDAGAQARTVTQTLTGTQTATNTQSATSTQTVTGTQTGTGSGTGTAAQTSTNTNTDTGIAGVSIEPEDQLIDVRLGAGVSVGHVSSSSPNADKSMLGVAFRLDVGPMISKNVALNLELGVRNFEHASYLELAVAPTYSINVNQQYLSNVTLTPVMGTALGGFDANLCTVAAHENCATRFQFFGGAEAGAWWNLTEDSEASLTYRIVNDMDTLASNYRTQCIDAASGKALDSMPCQLLATRLIGNRKLLDAMRAKSSNTICPLDENMIEAGTQNAISTAALSRN